MFDDTEADAEAEVTALLTAIARLVRLWGMSCGASAGAFRILQMSCLGTGSIHAEDWARFDEHNRAAALTVLRLCPLLGTDGMPITPELRAALERESARIGKLRGSRGNKE